MRWRRRAPYPSAWWRPSPLSGPRAFDLQRLDWFDLRNMLLVAHVVAQAALTRNESRGAHQREDFPQALAAWQLHQTVRWRGGDLRLSGAPEEALTS